MFRKGSLEVGVNTIVILVIAMVLLGLGVGFIKGMFNPINKLPGAIPIPDIGKEPGPANPIVLAQGEVSVKSGNIEQVKVGIYNAWEPTAMYTVGIVGCTDGVKPATVAYGQTILKGESTGFLVNVQGKDAAGVSIPEGTYICNIGAFKVTAPETAPTGTPAASTQFTFVVTG